MRGFDAVLVSAFNEPNSLKRSKFGPTQGAVGKAHVPPQPQPTSCYAENPPKVGRISPGNLILEHVHRTVSGRTIRAEQTRKDGSAVEAQNDAFPDTSRR